MEFSSSNFGFNPSSTNELYSLIVKTLAGAGYSEKYAGANADKLLKNTKIRAYIDDQLSELHKKNIMDAEEALSILSDIARGNRDEEVLMMKTNPLVSVTLNEGKLPFQNFRSTQDLWLDSALAHSTAGLHDMRLSGSSQFSEVGIDLFMKKIAKQVSPELNVLSFEEFKKLK